MKCKCEKISISIELAFKLQSLQWRAVSLSHWTASGVHEPTLTGRSARQHFSACRGTNIGRQTSLQIIDLTNKSAHSKMTSVIASPLCYSKFSCMYNETSKLLYSFNASGWGPWTALGNMEKSSLDIFGQPNIKLLLFANKSKFYSFCMPFIQKSCSAVPNNYTH